MQLQTTKKRYGTLTTYEWGGASSNPEIALEVGGPGTHFKTAKSAAIVFSGKYGTVAFQRGANF